VSEAVESIAIHVNDMTIHEKDVTLVSFNGDMIQVKGSLYRRPLRDFFIHVNKCKKRENKQNIQLTNNRTHHYKKNN
jgi:hypothetical protein